MIETTTRSVKALRELADEIEQGGYGTEVTERINEALSNGEGIFDSGRLLELLLAAIPSEPGTVGNDEPDERHDYNA